MLLTAVQAMVTSPSSSLLMVSLAPSFLMMVPVIVSPLVSTTWSAASRRRQKNIANVAIRIAPPVALAAFVGREMALLVFLSTAAPTGVVASDLGLGTH